MAKDPLNTLGASNHSAKERAKNDYYSTDPRSTRAMLAQVTFDGEIWEPTAGRHKMVNELIAAGYAVKATDLVDYGFGDEQVDFLKYEGTYAGNFCFNPPYQYAMEFVEKGLELLQPGKKMVVYLRTLFLEGQKRYERIFKQKHLKEVLVFSARQVCSKVDDYSEGSAVSYSFFVFEKDFIGDPIIKWL